MVKKTQKIKITSYPQNYKVINQPQTQNKMEIKSDIVRNSKTQNERNPNLKN